MPISPSSLNGYEFNSTAEKKIYVHAVESGYFNNAEKYLFHSLNMKDTGSRKLKAEIDFVYLDRDCILFFEVKGGQVKFDSLKNEWYVLGGTEKGDPFKQAYSALFHTRDKLLPELFQGRFVSERLVFGIGVLFPDCLKPKELRRSNIGQMEFDPEIIYDYSDDKLKDGLINFIKRTKEYWSKHSQYLNRKGLSQKEVSAISKYFRTDHLFRLPACDLIKRNTEETQRFTGMQMYVLDNLNYNVGKGSIVMGGPGTGKTLLALELLRKKVNDGKRVLLICYNRNLAEYLQHETKLMITDKEFTVINIHSLYKDPDFIGSDYDSVYVSNDKYWSRDLPLHFIRSILEAKKNYFDYLIIDEGQDILNEYHVDAVSKLLKGEFESGNWSIFMDKDFQNIYNDDAETMLNYVREVYPCFVYLLPLNCRNTRSTIKTASLQSGFPTMPCLRNDEIWKSEIKVYSSSIDLLNKVNDLINRMEQDGIERKNITILCFTKEQINNILKSNTNKFVESAFEIPNKINVATIHSYKGLENKFILICGPENYDPNNKQQMSLIYIANTRATAQSIFFINIKYQPIIVNRLIN